ncbi:ComF family protein [Vibrio ezurae]|uniref:ComF family protein n=1 Tax=Vibrio ezurae TaxID=252583 RepID=UPI0003F787D9|nr:ComF family protein [Vibrio ezurae]
MSGKALEAGEDRDKWCDTCHDKLTPITRCEMCGVHTATAMRRCGQCITCPPTWDKLFCVTEYQAPLSGFIHKLKYRRQVWHAKELGSLLARQINDPAPILLSVPLHWRRQLWRGFNQSDYLAGYLQQQFYAYGKSHVTYLPKALSRVKVTRNQMGLNRRQRLTNLRKAFLLSPNAVSLLQNQPHVALIDDVVTTGSTVSEICLLLKEHGVQRIDIYCICRASPVTL